MKFIAGVMLTICMLFGYSLNDFSSQPKVQTTNTVQSNSDNSTEKQPTLTGKQKSAFLVLIVIFLANGFMIYRNFKRRKKL